jgi:hypothetical protein
MIFPDYDRSIVNVAGSMIAAFGGKPLYKPLSELEFLRGCEKVVLLTIDGLGYNFLQKYGRDSFLAKHCVGKISSTFPTTTAAAEMALETGVAPLQHAITGWNMYLKELGTVSRVLLFEPRWGKCNFSGAGIEYQTIFDENKVAEKINSSSSLVMPRIVADSYKPFVKKELLLYDDLEGMVRRIKKAAGLPGRRYIFSYWLELDKICHKLGCKSAAVRDHFWAVDAAVAGLAEYLAAAGTCLVVTADHGLIDIPATGRVILNRDFPEIYDCLSLPLCGDTRAPYCYIKNGRTAEFKKLVREKLGFCRLRKSSDFIKNGMFGLGKPNPRIFERVGDYILVCDNGHLVRDYVMGEIPTQMEGFHGGMSADEMFVPLIIVR